MKQTEVQPATDTGVAPVAELKLDATYAELKKAIATHVLAPNTRVTENRLAEEFGYSKGTIRLVLSRLVSEGLVVSRGAKTQVVAPLTMADINQTFSLRNLLEPEAARLASLAKPDTTKLHALNIECQRGYVAGSPDEEYRFLSANAAFHNEIAHCCGNPRLAKWIGQLQDAAMRVLWISLRVESRPERWSHGHDDIIDAIGSGNAELASTLALQHLHAGQRMVFEIMSSLPVFQGIELAARR